MWWASAWACEPDGLDTIRPFPASAANGVVIDIAPTVVFTGTDGDRSVALIDAEGETVPSSVITRGGPVGGPDDGTWVVTLVPNEMLAENSAYRLVVDRGDVHQETTFRTGRQQGNPTGDVDPSLQIEQLGAPLSSTDPCDWRETTPVTLSLDPGNRAPNGILLVLRGDVDDAPADADVVWAGPASSRTEVALRVMNDPSRSCFAASIETLSGTTVTGPWVCGDVPASPSYEEDRANGKTSGGHGCATAPGSLGMLLLVGLLVRRR